MYTICYQMFYNMDVINNFSDWITRKYVEWRGDAIGQERSITDFAIWVGVSQQTMSGWMKRGGKMPRSGKSISALVKRFGNEVYELLGLPVPVPLIPFDKLPEDIQRDWKAALSEISSALGDIDPDSPEGDALVQEILAKHGFIVRQKSKSG